MSNTQCLREAMAPLDRPTDIFISRKSVSLLCLMTGLTITSLYVYRRLMKLQSKVIPWSPPIWIHKPELIAWDKTPVMIKGRLK